jgi:hypothetical protein
MNYMGKVLMKILINRSNKQLKVHVTDKTSRFRNDRSTFKQILMLELIAEQAKWKNNFVCNCFVDFQKAFDSIKQNII